MLLQPYPSPQPNEESVHTTVQAHTDTLVCHMERQTSLDPYSRISPHLMDKTSKLEYWLMDLEIAADILSESHTCLAEAKSHGLNCSLICEAL